MKKWTALGRAAAIGAIVLCSAAARGEPADICAVPSYLLFGDSLLNRVSAAVKKDKTLQIVALGGVSSTLPGPDGPNFAYPARLEAALVQQNAALAARLEQLEQGAHRVTTVSTR